MQCLFYKTMSLYQQLNFRKNDHISCDCDFYSVFGRDIVISRNTPVLSLTSKDLHVTCLSVDIFIINIIDFDNN